MFPSPKDLEIDQFTYHLPAEKIAVNPLPVRDSSKLLVYDEGKITDCIFNELPEKLCPKDFLIFNNTKVIPARIILQNTTKANIEIFCLEPADFYSDITTALAQKKEVFWNCLIGNATKWREDFLEILNPNFKIKVSIKEKKETYFVIHFEWSADLIFAEVLDQIGKTPIPPYIKREIKAEDVQNYQTVFSQEKGSVAAPTASLHFTQDLLQTLKNKNIHFDFLTLHVGAGTFMPVKSKVLGAHKMHEEQIEISKQLLENLKNNLSKNFVAVGTTALRSLESIYWMGLKLSLGLDFTKIEQWEVYTLPNENFTPENAIDELLMEIKKSNLTQLVCKTQILITPGYTFKFAKKLITNFHQPNSTLLLLVAAFVGDDWEKIYAHALENNYRFLSYGDSSLLKINLEKE